MKSTPKFLCALLAISLMLTLCACGREAQKKSAADVPPAQADLVPGQASAVFAPSTDFISAEDAGAYVYAQLPLAGYRVHAVLPADGDLVYAIATRCDANGLFLIGEDGVIPTQIVQYDLEAQQKTDFCYQPALDGARDAAISAAALGADGSLWCLACRFWRDGEALTKSFTLESVDADGTVSESVPLDCPEVRSDPELFVNSDGSFLLHTPEDGILTVYDASGQQTAQQSVELLTDPIAADADGQAWLCTDTEDRAALQAVGSEKQIPISGVTNGLPTLCYGTDAPGVLYAADSTALYRVSLENGATEKLADLSALGVRGGQRFSRTANGCFVFTDTSTDIPVLAALCPSSSGSRQKTVLTLATVTPDSEVLAQVRNFNRSSADYHVELLDFSALLDSGSYADVFTVWNTAIMAGDTPDMIDLSNLPWHSFADRGLLLDLNTLLPQEALLPWLWDALSYHGGNFTFPGCFTVETLVGKQSRLGNKSSWSVAEFLKLAEASDIPMFSGMSRELFLSYMEQYLLDAFWDEETGTCSFDGETFRELLEFANEFPAEFDYENSDMYDTYESDYSRMRSGKQLLTNQSFYGFDDLYVTFVAMENAPCFVGYPTTGTPRRSTFQTDTALAITAACIDNDAAWAFVRTTLQEEYQNEIWTLPINKSVFDAKLAEAMKQEFYTDENGNQVEQSKGGYGWGNDEMIDIYAVTPEQRDAFMELLHSTTSVNSYDESIMEIVREETGGYFAGQKTLDETVKIIQNRVSLYVAEQSN